MWEYTGTGWIIYLGHTKPIKDEQEQYEAVRDEDLEENSLEWLPPAPMNNTYGFAITQESAKKYPHHKSLSDIKDVPVEDRTFCVESEFANRPTGSTACSRPTACRPERPAACRPTTSSSTRPARSTTRPRTAAASSARCSPPTAGSSRWTSRCSRTTSEYFPNYNVSLVVREDVLADHPEIEDLIAPVTEKLTNEVLLRLNAEIDVEGREPADVALEWLQDEGFVQ